MTKPSYIDISPLISPKLAVWPGDTPFSRSVVLDTQRGDHLTLSSITTTLHIGAHTDAPRHYHKDGHTIDQVDLTPYIGMCHVVTPNIVHGLVVEGDWLNKLPSNTERILFRTSTRHQETFPVDFTAVSAGLIKALGKRQIKLLGIDSPSFDPYSSKDLPAHLALFHAGIANLEGLDLSLAPDGEYELIAIPLNIAGADASPVRAILKVIR